MQNDIKTAIYLLKGTNVNILDAVRILRGAIDLKPSNCSDDNISYLIKVVNLGISAVRRGIKSKPIFEAYQAYLEEKSSNLKPTSLRDIKTIANRIFRKNPTLKERFAGDISSEEWLKILNCQFPLPNQFNKARAMLHALYSFCLKMRWSEENPVSPISKKKIFEKEIAPLGVDKVQKLLSVGKTKKHGESAAALGIMLWTGMRPNEVSRLKWEDIDFSEKVITVKKENSKTGGARQIEMCPVLKKWLDPLKKKSEAKICPKNWLRKWKSLRDDAGFKHIWVNDVLRHTYASYFAKRYRDLPRLQLNMGHRDLSLLRSRYVNMVGIKKSDAKAFFESLGRDITYKTLPLN